LQHRFTLPVLLGRHQARYYECGLCHTLQIAAPHWLAEAYSRDDALNAENVDSARWIRNFSTFSYLSALKQAGVLPPDPCVLDFGGSHGILTQLLIDTGWDAWTHDPMVPHPVFATHRSLTTDDLTRHTFDVIVALEVLEHLVDVEFVRRQFRDLLRPGGVLALSTATYRPGFHDQTWDYLATDAGQHVTLWSKSALLHFGYHLGFRTVSFWPGGEGFLVVMSSLDQAALTEGLRVASACLHDDSHRTRITHNFDFRNVGVIDDRPAVVEEVPRAGADSCSRTRRG
jgi:SAM-dependent methyltransferase